MLTSVPQCFAAPPQRGFVDATSAAEATCLDGTVGIMGDGLGKVAAGVAGDGGEIFRKAQRASDD